MCRMWKFYYVQNNDNDNISREKTAFIQHIYEIT